MRPQISRLISMLSVKRSAVLSGLVLVCLVTTASALAQPEGRKLGVGGVVGRTNGLSIKLYLSPTIQAGDITDIEAIDINMSSNLKDYFFWTGHLLRERQIPDSPLHYFIGPGIAFGRERGHMFWALSATVGVYFERERFEVFMQISPRIIVLPNVQGEFGSGVGLRYYF